MSALALWSLALLAAVVALVSFCARQERRGAYVATGVSVGVLAVVAFLGFAARGGSDVSVVVTMVILSPVFGIMGACLGVAFLGVVRAVPQTRARMGWGSLAGLIVAVPFAAGLVTFTGSFGGPVEVEPSLLPLLPLPVLAVIGALAGGCVSPDLAPQRRQVLTFWLGLSLVCALFSGGALHTRYKSTFHEQPTGGATAVTNLMPAAMSADPSAMPQLVRALRDRDPGTRRAAVLNLTMANYVNLPRHSLDPEIVPLLGQEARGEDAQTRRDIVNALCRMVTDGALPHEGFAKVGPVLKKLTSDSDPQVSSAAQKAWDTWHQCGGYQFD